MKLLISFIPVKKNKIKNKNIILILSHNNLGDVVCDSISIQSLKNHYLDSYLVVLVRRKEGVEFLKYCDLIDEVLVLPSSKSNFLKFIEFSLTLKKYNFTESFQLVRIFSQWNRAYLPYFVGIKKRYGILNKNSLNENHCCFTKYCVENKYRNRVTESIDIIKLSGVHNFNFSLKTWYTLENISQYTTNSYIIIQPGASIDKKRWPEKNFLELVKMISTEFSSIEIFIITSPKECFLYKFFVENCKQYKNVKVVGDLKINTYLNILSNSKLIICNDSGPMHFSIANNIYCLALFGPTPPIYAIDKNLSKKIVIMRSKCDKKYLNCDVYRNSTNERKNLLKDICLSENCICVDSISIKSVYNVFKKIYNNIFI